MYWANFMHMYQPPTQKPYWVKRVADESYRPVFRGLVERPTIKSTININAVLVELLDANGCADVIADIRTLLERGQIELTASAKYHALLPFLPVKEIQRQVRLNNESHRKYFGEAYQPKGFFPPEMAYSPAVAQIVADMGFDWMIVDELSFPTGQKPDHAVRYTVEGLDNLGIFFRERQASWSILSGEMGTAKLLLENFASRLPKHEYLLTAMDGETFGHHRPGMEKMLFEMTNQSELPTVKLSELTELFPETKAISTQPSTWALMEKDLERNAPFSRWLDPDNEIHTLQWKLLNLALKVAPHQSEAEDTLDRALHSDQFWWASARPWWSIEMIERGSKELYDAIIAADVSAETKAKAKGLYSDIVFTAFAWQRSGKVDDMSKSEDEDIRQRTDSHLPKLPKAEVQKMVDRLEEEMKKLADNQEYERAAQLRDRANEVRQYAADVDKPKGTSSGTQEWED